MATQSLQPYHGLHGTMATYYEQRVDPTPPKLKIRLKQPAAPPELTMIPTEAIGTLWPQQVKAKRQSKPKHLEEEPAAKRPKMSPYSTALPPAGPSTDPPPKPRLGRPPGRPPKSHTADGAPRETGKRAGSVPLELNLGLDLATLLRVKDKKPRSWVKQWVDVKTVNGTGSVRILKWVPDGPPQLPPLHRTIQTSQPKFNRNVSSDSLAGIDPSRNSIDPYAVGGRLSVSGSSVATPPGGTPPSNGTPPMGISPEGITVQMFPCIHPGCKKMFPSMASMRKHAHMHSEKTFVCDYPGCTKAFVDASKLKRHKMVHTNERPFKCPACNKDFALEFNMRSHVKNMHPELGLQLYGRGSGNGNVVLPAHNDY